MQRVEKDLTVLFSGRFDRPNVGHIVNLARLGRRFKHVIVPVLQYPGQEYSAHYRAGIISDALSHCDGSYDVHVNHDHFGKITKEEAEKYTFDVYASGNHECLQHMEELGFDVMYVERAYDYNSTDGRVAKKIKELLL